MKKKRKKKKERMEGPVVWVLYASQKGCAEGLAKDFAQDLVSGGVEGVCVMSMEQFFKQVIFVSFVWFWGLNRIFSSRKGERKGIRPFFFFF